MSMSHEMRREVRHEIRRHLRRLERLLREEKTHRALRRMISKSNKISQSIR